MNIPEFTAQASLYRTSNSYRSLAFDRASLQRTVLVPQLGGPGFEGYGNCISDCIDTKQYYNPKLTYEEAGQACAGACRDPGGTSPGPRVGYGPSCGNSPPDSCANKRAVCCAFTPGFPFTCAGICEVYYDICLEDSRRECLIARHGPLTGGSSYPLTVEFPSAIPFGNPPPPPPPVNNCIFGGAPCGTKCCLPGLECCGVFNGQPDCKTSCLH